MSELDPTPDDNPEEESRGDAEDLSREDAENQLESMFSAAPGEEAPSEEAPREHAAGELDAIVEALIFASPEPLTPKALGKLLSTEPAEDVAAALARVTAAYERPGGLQMVQVAGGYQIVTRPELHEWVRRLFHEQTKQKLSVQALETLSVIAYKQPVTAAEITEIRGVNTSGVLNTLIERQLIKIAGRKQVVGRPFLYATTREFLDRFGLKDLADLPKIEDMADALGFEPPAGLTESQEAEAEAPARLQETADVSAGLEASPRAADPDAGSEASEDLEDPDEDFEDEFEDDSDPDDSDDQEESDDSASDEETD